MARHGWAVLAIVLGLGRALLAQQWGGSGQSEPPRHPGYGQAAQAPRRPDEGYARPAAGVNPAYPPGRVYPQANPGYPQPNPAYPPGNPPVARPAEAASGSPAAAVAAQPPFVLSREEEARLDQVLRYWEQRSGNLVKTFSAQFTRLEYDMVFKPPTPGGQPEPAAIEHGELHYAAPDRGRFEMKGERPATWVCDGKAVFEYRHDRKVVIEYKLPPDAQGKGINNGPLPFLFGMKAEALKQRYFLRLITPAQAQGQVWIEAYPRFQADAANFRSAEVILGLQDMQPVAMRLFDAAGSKYWTYKFQSVAVNKKDFWDWFKKDPFRGEVPFGWKLVDASALGPSGGEPPRR